MVYFSGILEENYCSKDGCGGNKYFVTLLRVCF